MTKQQLLDKLGYTDQDRLLIVHSDDFGMCHSANVGTMRALNDGVCTSASILMPCPWAHEALAMWKQHPHWSIGVEFCLTSEWEHYRWGPLSSRDKVASLVGPDGCFWHNEPLVAEHAKLEHVEIECRAQVERMLSLGLQPSHTLCHMNSLRWRDDLHELFLKLAVEYQLPARYPELELAQPWPVNEGHVGMEHYSVRPIERRQELIFEAIRQMKPGIWEIFGHCSVEGEEIKANTTHERGRPDVPDSWRTRIYDADMFCSDELRQLLSEESVQIISWREIRKSIMGSE